MYININQVQFIEGCWVLLILLIMQTKKKNAYVLWMKTFLQAGVTYLFEAMVNLARMNNFLNSSLLFYEQWKWLDFSKHQNITKVSSATSFISTTTGQDFNHVLVKHLADYSWWLSSGLHSESAKLFLLLQINRTACMSKAYWNRS